MRLHFARIEMPEEARLFVYSAQDSTEFYGPYKTGQHDLTTPPITGSEAVVEIFIPEKASSKNVTVTNVTVTIDRVTHIFQNARKLSPTNELSAKEDAANCNNEVAAEWRETAKSVGLIQFQQPDGEYLCSGVLMNDSSNSGTPYFLTANHCISDAQTANSAQVYWFYDNPSAKLSSNSSYSARLIKTSDANDYSLLQIKGTIPAGVRFSGWTSVRPSVSMTVTSIHHPDGDYKRMSTGHIVATTCPDFFQRELCGNFHEVKWDSGITEGGSSGGGLWVGTASDPKLIGQLWGGESSCMAPSASDYFGKFETAMEELAPILTRQGCRQSISHKRQIIEGSGGQFTVSVFANETGNCPWVVWSNADWIKVQTAQGAGDGVVSFTVDPNSGSALRGGLLFVAGNILRIFQRGTSDICAAAQPVSLGSSVSGNLSAGGCQSVNGYGAPVVRYSFTTQPGQFFSLGLQSTAFDAYLTLIGPDGRVIQENDDISPDNLNSRLPKSFFNNQMGVPVAGTYTIEVSAISPMATGGFTLTLEKGCSFKAVGKYQKYSAYGVPLGTSQTDRQLYIEVESDATCSRANINTLLLHNTTWLGTDYAPAFDMLFAELNNHQGTARFNLPVNETGKIRRGLIDFAGHQILLEQLGFCNSTNQPTLTPMSASYNGRDQSGSFQVKMPGEGVCTWELNRNVVNWPDWIVYGSNWGDQSSDFLMTYRVNVNKTATARTAPIKISDQLHTVQQESFNKTCPPVPIQFGQEVAETIISTDCQDGYEGARIPTDRYSFRGYTKQQVAFTLTALAGNVELLVLSPTGNTVFSIGSSFSAGALRYPSSGYWDLPEDGVYTIEARPLGQPPVLPVRYNFRVDALGGADCVFLIDATSKVANVAGGIIPIALTCGGNCQWNAISEVNWVSFPDGASGQGGKNVSVRIAANTGAPRETRIQIAGREIYIFQDAPCSYIVAENATANDLNTFYTFWGEGGAGFRRFYFVTGNSCSFTAKSNTDWITNVSLAGKSVAMTIHENRGSVRRGEIEISGVKFQVVQGAGNLAVVSGADYSNRISRQGIISVFGNDLAAESVNASLLPLPLSLSDITNVSVWHPASGQTTLASIFYASPGQLNLLLPEYLLSEGAMRIDVHRRNGLISSGSFTVERLAPALFSAESNGAGIAAANTQRIRANGEQQFDLVSMVDGTGKIVGKPIDLSVTGDRVYLLLYGVGTRLRNELQNVSCEIDGVSYPVEYAGPQGYFVGVDQINILLPNSLRGKGEVTVRLKVEAKVSNTVKIKIAP
jgi:uncharacterized protein (TIGR03437 family)